MIVIEFSQVLENKSPKRIEILLLVKVLTEQRVIKIRN